MSSSSPEHPAIALARGRLARHTPVEHTDTTARAAAVAIILQPYTHSDVRVLFIRRAEFESDPWSGQIAFPGGRAEIGDADLLQTALRETFEETGVDFSPDYELLGRLDDLHSRTVLLPNVFVRPFVIAVGNAPDFERSPEVAEVFWMPLSKLRDQGSWRMTTVHARGRELQVRACDFEGRIIWGMTERIISQLVTVLK